MKNPIKLLLLLLALLLPTYSIAQNLKTGDRLAVTPTPEIIITETDDAIIINVDGEGDVHVSLNGEEIEVPYTVEKGDEPQTIVVTATAQGEDMEISETATETVVVPAKTNDDPHMEGHWLVLVDQNDNEEWVVLYQSANNPNNWVNMYTFLPQPWGPVVRYYFMVDGVRYGAPEDMQPTEPTAIGPFEETAQNPLYETDYYYTIEGGFTYTLGMQDLGETKYVLCAQGGHASGSWSEYQYVYDFEVDGIYYCINNGANNSVYVTYPKVYVESYSGWYSYETRTPISYYSGDITIPETVFYDGATYTVDYIGDDAFINCSNLTSVTIPSSITSIGDRAFSGCTSLTSIDIPEYVMYIGSSAFQECIALKNLNFNAISCEDFDNEYYGYYDEYDNYVEYHANPFYNLNIQTINIGNSVQRIPAYFAYEMTELDHLSIGNSVTSVGSYAFSYCCELTSLTIPNSINSIGDDAFYGCSGLTDLVWNAKNCNYNGNMPAANIARVVIGQEVETIPDNFVNGSKITNVTIPNSVITIGNYAFSNCNSLTDSLIIPNSVTTIGNSAFRSCSGLSKITLGNSVTYIGNYAFNDCSGLTGALIIPNSVTSIGEDAFCGIKKLNSIVVEDGNCFYDSRENCNALIESASNSLIIGCQNTIIPISVTNIGNKAFLNCSGLISFTIPNSVTSIGNRAFYGCNDLTSVNIGKSITNIGNEAFYGCTALDTLYFNAVSIADFSSTDSYRPFYNLNIKTIIIGDEVQKIPAYFAYGLTKLTSITIGGSVKSIGNYSFNGCSALNNLTIPKSVTTIGKQAFNNNPSIELVTCEAETPPTWNDIAMFTANVYNHSPLYVPMGSVRTYQSDQCWGQFSTIIGKNMSGGILAKAISLNQSQLNLQVGGRSQLTATVLPDSTTNKTVNWMSSDSNIATVDESGWITAIVPGVTTITATTTDGSDLSASCMVIVVEDVSVYDNYFALPDTSVYHGDEITIPVRLNNGESIMAFQADIYLPEGFTLVTDEDDEPIITPSSRLTSDHVIMADQLNDGGVRVICYNMSEQLISGNEGDLFYITVATPGDAGGDYVINLRNGRLTAVDYNEIRTYDTEAILTVNTYTPGDVNDSRTVNVTDIVFTAQYIMQRNPSPFIFEAADMNGDGEITVTDIMLIARLILYPTMKAPMRAPAAVTCYDCMSGEGISVTPGETQTVSIMLDNEMDYSAFQLDMMLPTGLTASNFQLTDRAGSHALDVETLLDGKTRVLCYSPAIETITGNSGALLTFDVTAMIPIVGDINVDGIEMVTADCQTVRLDNFAIGVNNASTINEVASGKTIARVDYFNVAGQQIDRPENGVTLVVTTYTDGTRTATKLIR